MVRQRYKKMAKLCYYICSPLSAPTQAGIMKNKEQAGRYVEIVSRITDKRAIAPHAILPGHFDDNIPEERDFFVNSCTKKTIAGNTVGYSLFVKTAANVLNTKKTHFGVPTIKQENASSTLVVRFYFSTDS